MAIRSSFLSLNLQVHPCPKVLKVSSLKFNPQQGVRMTFLQMFMIFRKCLLKQLLQHCSQFRSQLCRTLRSQLCRTPRSKFCRTFCNQIRHTLFSQLCHSKTTSHSPTTVLMQPRTDHFGERSVRRKTESIRLLVCSTVPPMMVTISSSFLDLLLLTIPIRMPFVGVLNVSDL